MCSKNIWPNKFTFAGSFVKTLEFLICVGKINGWASVKCEINTDGWGFRFLLASYFCITQ